MQNSDILKEHISVIHNQKLKMDKYWNQFTLALLKQISLTERIYHHQIIPHQHNSLMINIFGNLQLNIARTTFFGPVTIDYKVTLHDITPVTLPVSFIDGDGLLDGVIPLTDPEQIFEHYLLKLKPVYEHLTELSRKEK